MPKYDRFDLTVAIDKGISMKLAGETWETIAEKCLGSDGQPVWSTWRIAARACNRVMANRTSLLDDERRLEEVARLDELKKVLWPKCQEGDLGAIARWVDLQNQSLKMVAGLEVPKNSKVEYDGPPTTVVFKMPEHDKSIVPEAEDDNAGV